MNKNIYHLLNGDALKGQFPIDIPGHRLVARLCLVDGEVESDDLDDFFEKRACFISKNYPNYSKEDYFEGIEDILQLKKLSPDVELNLWFEKDLFCQVNFWFVASMIHKHSNPNEVYLVLPKIESPYSFGHMTKSELQKAFTQRVKITSQQLARLTELWQAYQKNNFEVMHKVSDKLLDAFPFVKEAVTLHQGRQKINGQLSAPESALLSISEELQTTDLGPILSLFIERHGAYGFGDLQVKKMLKTVLGET